MQVVLAKYPLLSQDHQSKGDTKSATEVRMIRTKLDISFFFKITNQNILNSLSWKIEIHLAKFGIETSGENLLKNQLPSDYD